MIMHRRIPLRSPLWAITVFGLLALGVIPGPAADPASPREPQAAQAEKQQDPAASGDMLPAEWVKALSWRSIGPANMSGRITAISVFDADPSTYWIATAGGGLLKTVNNGVTFEHQFDHEATVSIGDVCVAPSDRNVVWVGTGENNPRNSVSYGDGVYKSTDGGKTWTNMGLKKSFQTGRLLVHPTNPDIVYVGSLGRLYGPSEERGLYKTTDGGKTWNRILYVDDRSGVIDMRFKPDDPETLLVATYERQRDGFDVNEPAKRWGEGSGLFKTTDGGKSFRRINSGLPTCKLGRIGLDWYRKDPNVVFAIVESEKNGMGPPPVAAAGGYLGIQSTDSEDKGARLTVVTADGPADKAGLKVDDVVTKLGDKTIKTNQELIEAVRGYKPDDKTKVTLLRGVEEKVIEVTFAQQPPAGGRGGRGGRGGGGAGDPNRPYQATLNGQQENVQDRQGPDGFQTGGVYRSADGGNSWARVNSINPRPMYFSQVRVDPSDEKNLYVLGVSQYRSVDNGKTFTGNAGRGVHADGHALWIDPKDGRHMLIGCDGGFYVTYDRGANWDHLNDVAIGQFYHVALDTRRDYKVYGGLQDNGTWGGPSRTHTGTGPVNEDWISVGGGDGFRCQVDPNDPDQIYYTSQNGAMGRRNLRTGEVASVRPGGGRGGGGGQGGGGRGGYRFNWNTPFILSSHNTKIFYCAGNYVFRSLDRGSNPLQISPEITATRQGSATALSESPKNPNVLYVGTDDGYLWVTKDGGKEWTNITKNVGLPGLRWVASIEASRFEEGRAYVVFDGHRSDDDAPYVYVTEDFGKTWKSLNANLPTWGSTRVLREDLSNPNLLYLGTEFAVWATLDRGQAWAKINNNLPTVAVLDFAIHPTAGEIVAATHGRSLWICDVSALRQITADARKADAFVYKPTSVVRFRPEPGHGRTNRRFVGENPPQGTMIYYSLNKKADKANLKIVDIEGKTVRELAVETAPGLHKVNWNLAGALVQGQGGFGGRGGRGGGGGGGGRGGRGGGAAVPAGAYKVVLTVDGKEYATTVRVEGEAVAAPAGIVEDEDN